MINLQESADKRPVREQLDACIQRYSDHVSKSLKLQSGERKMIYALLQFPKAFLDVLEAHYQKYRHDQGGSE